MNTRIRTLSAAMGLMAAAPALAQTDGVTAMCVAGGVELELCLCATLALTETESENDLAIFSTYSGFLMTAQANGAGSLASVEGSLIDTGAAFGVGAEDVRSVRNLITARQAAAVQTCREEAEAARRANGG